VLCAALLAVGLGGCLGDDGDDVPEAPRGVLTVYMSLPARGLSADEAAAVEAGARLAFRQARGKAGAHTVRLVRLDSTRTTGKPWDPGQVQANAERASDDPSAVAYIGELGLGGSAISVPVTNDAGLLQVSPFDSLTSLTRPPPGQAGRGAPERYYPTGRRTFLRLTPNDLREVELLTGRLGTLGAPRVALVAGEGVYAEELVSQLVARLRRAGHTLLPVDTLTDDPGSVRARVAQIVEERPDAIVYAGLGDRPAERLLAGLATALPDTPVLAGSGVLERAPLRFGPAPARVEAYSSLAPAGSYGRTARRLLEAVRRHSGPAAARPEALYGFEASRLVLDAVAKGGSRRAAVVAAALRPRPRRSPVGRYEIKRSGDVTGPPLVLYRLENGVFQPLLGSG
jgi:branched-chain amino acid transport system substrate-binding protein